MKELNQRNENTVYCELNNCALQFSHSKLTSRLNTLYLNKNFIIMGGKRDKDPMGRKSVANRYDESGRKSKIPAAYPNTMVSL